MIALRQKATQRPSESTVHAKFLELLPKIRRQANIAFRNALPDAREELIAEVVANAYSSYCRLVELGKEDVAFATPLACFAIRRVRSCRFLGGRLKDRDVMSGRVRGSGVGRLDCFDSKDGTWQEIVVEDRRAGPAEIAACRIDFSTWLRLLPRRQRKVALMLAGGESTSEAAKKFGVTAGRISQLRLWLKESWERFQGEASQARLAAI
jgi:DNA-directed RNA polymerase specialized sigma24 family protein